MQISASSILTSQQQAARAAQSSAQPAADDFAPLVFKKSSAPVAPAQASATTQSVAPASQAQTIATSGSAAVGYVRPGTHIDIKI